MLLLALCLSFIFLLHSNINKHESDVRSHQGSPPTNASPFVEERMTRLLNLLSVLLIRSFVVSDHDVFDTGRQKYQQLLSLSSSPATTSSCWHDVLTMLHKHCSLDELDRYQSTIAYQFTLCHLSTMNNDLGNLPCPEGSVHLCVEKLHQHMNAFIGE